MDNTLGRTISETEKNLIAGNTLSYNNVLALIDAYEYGTAPSMISLIKTLRMIYLQVGAGKQINYMDKDGFEKTISINTFEEFILNTFDEFVLKEVYSEDKNELYK
ncbi:MAG: hypothetical protein E7263_08710 [Lachnospiraceae bacterium]|nr:hypothetical protein [Lachnospiraceae bacterium]